MKTKLLTALLLAIAITGCQKQPEEATASQNADPVTQAQFDKSDKKIAKFLDQLENPNTPQEVRKQILCVDYPAEYKDSYMPALMKLSHDYTRIKLLADLDYILNYYKKKDDIQC